MMWCAAALPCRCGIMPLFPEKFIVLQMRRHQIAHLGLRRAFSNSRTNHSKVGQGLRDYWNSLKWFSIPAGLGFAYISYLQFRHIQERERRIVLTGSPEDALLSEWQVNVIKSLPTRFLSQMFGKLMAKELPETIKEPLFTWYSKKYGCNLEEALVQDLKEFKTFRDFFTRKLKSGIRPIDSTSSMVSPVDGTVLHFGRMDAGSMSIEQVKGISYPLPLFTGPRHPFTSHVKSLLEKGKENMDAVSEERSVFFCNIYLGPGDYHWFHSPSEWVVEGRRHIPGILWSVSPSSTRTIRGLFHFNERILLSGRWKHGFLLMAAVGAYNVGSIELNFAVEKGLETNSPFAKAGFSDRLYGGQGLALQRGDPVGHFSLGSTIVLVFTAPSNFRFCLQPGQKLAFGQALGSVVEARTDSGA